MIGDNYDGYCSDVWFVMIIGDDLICDLCVMNDYWIWLMIHRIQNEEIDQNKNEEILIAIWVDSEATQPNSNQAHWRLS